MQIEDLEKYKSKIERKIKRSRDRVEDYKSYEDNLSVYGHWSLGYYEGINSTLENLLDDIEETIQKQYETEEKINVNNTNWIPCNLISPIDDEEVLLTFKNEVGLHVGEALFKKDTYFYFAETNIGYYQEPYSTPIAWMRKPKPYVTN